MLASVLALSPSVAGAQPADVVVGDGESIQVAIDAAEPGTKIIIEGDHTENVWIQTDGIQLEGRNNATLRAPENVTLNPCGPGTLICVHPNPGAGGAPPDAADYVDGVSITSIRFLNSAWDSIGILFTNNISVRNNRILRPGCDGIFVIFADGVRVERNVVIGAGNIEECSGINVVAATNGRIHRNLVKRSARDGISLFESSIVAITRNRVSGSCTGIAIGDGPDEGFGGVFEEDVPSERIRVIGNRSNANNTTCEFGPALVGAAGIVMAGVKRGKIARNTTNNNVSTEMSLTAGGIHVTDFPNEDGSVFSATDRVRVLRNRATGNSSAGTAADIVLVASGRTPARGNNCGVGVPNQSICD